jgi:lipopolysaccharide transport system permease protein
VSATILVIRARRGSAGAELGELWAHRELFSFLVWRDVKLRYKQTALGIAWAVLQPLLAMVAFTVVFGRFARLPSDGVPYALFAYAGLVPWMFFTTAITQAADSLVGGANLLTKVYFPRIVLPLAAASSPALDLGITLGLLFVFVLFYAVMPTAALLLLPCFLLLLFVVVVGAGLWLAALNVEYRDVRHALPFLTQFWLWITPIAYPGSLVPSPWRVVSALNPMTGVVEGIRASVLGTPMPWAVVGVSALSGLVLFVTGLLYFRRVEDGFADRV